MLEDSLGRRSPRSSGWNRKSSIGWTVFVLWPRLRGGTLRRLLLLSQDHSRWNGSTRTSSVLRPQILQCMSQLRTPSPTSSGFRPMLTVTEIGIGIGIFRVSFRYFFPNPGLVHLTGRNRSRNRKKTLSQFRHSGFLSELDSNSVRSPGVAELGDQPLCPPGTLSHSFHVG